MKDSLSRIAANSEGLKKIRDAKDNSRTPEGKKWTYQRIADTISQKGYISDDTVERFFQGKAVYRDNAIAIAEVFGFSITDIALRAYIRTISKGIIHTFSDSRKFL